MAADNVTLNAGSGGATIRTLSDGTNEWAASIVCYAATVSPGANVLQVVTASAGLPVAQQGTWTVTANAGTGTFAVSAASLPLPTGAATSAKQPAIGTAGTASTDVITVQGIASMTALKVDGSVVTQPISGTVTANAGTGTFGVSGTVTANVGTTNGLALDATLTGGTQKTKLVDSGGTNVATVSAAGALKVDGSGVTQPVSIGATVAVTQSGTWNLATVTTVSTVSAVTAITNPLPAGTNTIGAVTPAAAASGGATPYHLISAASTNATSVKGSPGVVYALSAGNTNAAARFLKLYDKATAPAVGTDTPVLTMIIPASGGGFTLPIPVGLQFSAGIALAITGGIADSDATAVGANDVCLSLGYK